MRKENLVVRNKELRVLTNSEMQNITTCLRKHSHKASQSYLLTKLECFTKEELGITVAHWTGKQIIKQNINIQKDWDKKVMET